MVRVVGSDPGTSSLDLLMLVDGEVAQQARLSPESLRADPNRLVALLRGWEPIDLIAGPSGYGVPFVKADAFEESHLELMSLVRPNDRNRDTGVVGFRSWVRSLVGSGLPVVFLPGGIHLATIPAHRKANAIDLGTADKVAVTALALWAHAARSGAPYAEATFAVVEIGSAFSAVLVVERGRIVDASAGTRGPIGLRSSGAWDGEVAYWRSPLAKDDLFHGGLLDLGPVGPAAFRESLVKHVAGLQAVTPFEQIYLSGSALEGPDIAALVTEALIPLGAVTPLASLPNAWVKHAAQGAALLAEGLAGGRHADLVASLELLGATGTALDYV